jgi:hypothetical protein
VGGDVKPHPFLPGLGSRFIYCEHHGCGAKERDAVHQVCAAPDCANKVHARGLCQKHYMAWRRGDLVVDALTRAEHVNPLVCVCPEPLDPTGCGECRRCRRCVPSLLHPKALA